MLNTFTIALLSVYDKSNLIDFATALSQSGVRLLGSGGTAKKIRDAGLTIECVLGCSEYDIMVSELGPKRCCRYHKAPEMFGDRVKTPGPVVYGW